MAATTPYMGLKVWNLLTDSFDHTQLAENLAKLDQHTHAEGKGLKIPTGGIEDGAISAVKLATKAVTDAKILNAPIRGIVTSAGVITLGSGFTVSKGGTGVFTITFSPALPTAPAVVSDIGSATAGYSQNSTTTPTTTTATVLTFNTAGTATDLGFHFIAIPN